MGKNTVRKNMKGANQEKQIQKQLNTTTDFLFKTT